MTSNERERSAYSPSICIGSGATPHIFLSSQFEIRHSFWHHLLVCVIRIYFLLSSPFFSHLICFMVYGSPNPSLQSWMLLMFSRIWVYSMNIVYLIDKHIALFKKALMWKTYLFFNKIIWFPQKSYRGFIIFLVLLSCNEHEILSISLSYLFLWYYLNENYIKLFWMVMYVSMWTPFLFMFWFDLSIIFSWKKEWISSLHFYKVTYKTIYF